MKKILFFAHEVYEDLELWYPKIRLQEAGFETVVAGEQAGKPHLSKHGYPCPVDLSFNQVKMSDYAGIVIPGGFAPDKLRRIPDVLSCIRQANTDQKLIAFICHGGWVPISAKILKGKKATGTKAIRDDLENAGAIWQDRPVVIDGHLISSRTPVDLAPFSLSIVRFFESHR